ncbi:MAG TPA: cation diffusion facilitator family transporter [Caulobacteraceae bacterium]|jgi:cation diffusion facilitator family transporter|nr:cation diffusion facilitator family transporter [Caulobacteraceae bacterium]
MVQRPTTPDRRLIRLATTVSVAMAVILTLAKAAVWRSSGSVALMASMADSALDLAAATGTFFAVRYAAAPPDAEHRFGHGKAEAFASLMQAGLVFASAALVGEEAIQRMLRPEPVTHAGLGIAVMVVSIALTALLIAVQTRALSRSDSIAVEADRTHYLLDLASNIVALAAIAATAIVHLPLIDPLAGLVIVALLLRGAVSVFRQAADQLMDRELPDEARDAIVRLIKADPAILDVHQLRTRAAGPITYIQMHADLDPELSLEAAHKVVVAAERRVLSAYPAADILIHADPRGRAEPHGGAFAER